MTSSGDTPDASGIGSGVGSGGDSPPPLPHMDPPPLPVTGEERQPLPEVRWRWWEAFAVFALTFVTAAVLGVVVAAIFRGDAEKAAAVVAFELALGFWTVVWVKARFGLGPRALGVRFDRTAGDVSFGLGMGALGWFVSTLVVGNIVVRIVDSLSKGPVTEPDQLDYSNPSAIVLAITAVGVIVVAPIAEELFFRGFVYRGFRRDAGLIGAAVGSGLLFMLAHLPFWLIFPSIFTLGLFLAWVFERRGSLISTIVAHALFNAIGFVAYMVTR